MIRHSQNEGARLAEFQIHEHVPLYPNARAVADPDRLAMVRQMGLLDSPAEAAFDRMVRLAAQLLHAPTSVLTVLDDRRQFFKSAYGLGEPWATLREMPLSYSYCQYSLDLNAPLVINDSRNDPFFRESPALWQNNMVAYAGVPLIVNGQALGALCVIDSTARDWTTEQVEMLELLAASVTTEIQLRHELARRGEIERMKDEFMSVVGHELRTPLTSIRASLGMLASGKLGAMSAPADKMLAVAVRNADRLLRLLNDVIDVERLTTGHVELLLERVKAGEVINRATESMQALADQAGVSLDTRVVDADVTVDADRITQVLTNLVSNAIKFSPAGSAVDIDSTLNDGFVLLQVRDHGRGIPAAKLESIFDRFQQVESGDARAKGGAGLGLAIARAIVEQHGGSVWAESAGDGAGSTFTVRLPVSSG
jgi:signal transduction histidine kinase